MIGLGLRLVVSGGREAITRLVILAVAVGLGVGLLLTAVAATNAVTTWNSRHAWYWTGTAWVPPGPATGVAPLWWHPGSDIFNGQTNMSIPVANIKTALTQLAQAGGKQFVVPNLPLLGNTPFGQFASGDPNGLNAHVGQRRAGRPGVR